MGKYSFFGQTSTNNNKQITVIGNNVKAFRNNLNTSNNDNNGYRAITLDPDKGIELYTSNSKTDELGSLNKPNFIINNDGQILKKLNIIETDNNNINDSNNKIIAYVKKNLSDQPSGTVIEFLTNYDIDTHSYKALINDKMTIRLFKFDLINNKTEFVDFGI